ncbi:MAG TPA: hypothetical protein VNG31_02400 [Candidatus Baltobacteraceae bacterium]|nr:hypothetical protein [Candidatus Baltobacteraceae bacterium]
MRIAAIWAAAAFLAVGGATSPPSQAATAPRPRAELGIELPTLGIAYRKYHYRWPVTRRMYFSSAVMADIRDNLHASYVRTGWIPEWVERERKRPWLHENQALDTICSSGLRVMLIVPTHVVPPSMNRLADDVKRFLAHYTKREFGCIRWAELGNEADLRDNGFADVQAYAAYYERIAPIVASFGVRVITSGVSGADRPWTATLAMLLRKAKPPPPLDGFGFHPYGIPARDLAAQMEQMREAARGDAATAAPIYVTEIGRSDPTELYRTIVALARQTPALTIYEYRAQPNDAPADAAYGLKDHPALYEAVKNAWADISAGSYRAPERRAVQLPAAGSGTARDCTASANRSGLDCSRR